MEIRPRPAPALGLGAHKGDAGRLLVLAGSRAMPGAALLACRAAHRAGAGLVALLDRTGDLARVVTPASPETVHVPVEDRLAVDVLGERADDALVAGPGIGVGGSTRAWIDALLARWPRPLALDADALNVLASDVGRLREAAGPLVLTPHPGEAARLLGRSIPEDERGRVASARELARATGSVCCLKGAGTVVTDTERVYVNTTGNPGMATAGAGDVLLGILGAYLVAAGRESSFGVFDAAVSAVFVHGLAGDLAAAKLGQRAVIASDLVDFLPAAQRLMAAEPGEQGEHGEREAREAQGEGP